MNQTVLILLSSVTFLFFVSLGIIFFISRKSQRVMQSLLDFITNPETAKIQDATRVLQFLLKDEITKIDDNFKSMTDTLQKQIAYIEQIKQELTEHNDKLVETADDATKKIVNMSQRLDNTVDGLQTIVSSNGWKDVQQITDVFSGNVDTLLNKITSVSDNVSEKSEKIQEQINQCVESEKQISEQLQSSFDNGAENMNKLTESAQELQQHLTDLTTNVTDGFNNVKTSAGEYDETMKQNDKLLNDYLTKISSFTKQANKELTNQVNKLTETSNLVAGAIRLSESSVDKRQRALEKTKESLDESIMKVQSYVASVGEEMNNLKKLYDDEVGDFSKDVVKELREISTIANTTLDKTKTAATELSSTVKDMGDGVQNALGQMNQVHTQLSGQSQDLIRMFADTMQQLQPLSELIEKYYKALPDLSTGSKEMSDNVEKIVDTLVEKITMMKTTISESVGAINDSSTKLGTLAGQSRQEMIDLMADYTKAVEAMQSLNKQMMIARASAPMEAIKVAPAPNYKPVSTKDFLTSVDKMFEKLYELSVDLTRSIGTEIPDVIWKKYNDGDSKIFAKWLVKMFEATNKKQIHELLKSDKVFGSQATQFMRNFEKILKGADQTNEAEKLKATLLKTDLGTIYNTLHKNA